MEKFFDKESLLDVMYVMKDKAKIDDKSYRSLFKINDPTRIIQILTYKIYIDIWYLLYYHALLIVLQQYNDDHQNSISNIKSYHSMQ